MLLGTAAAVKLGLPLTCEQTACSLKIDFIRGFCILLNRSCRDSRSVIPAPALLRCERSEGTPDGTDSAMSSVTKTIARPAAMSKAPIQAEPSTRHQSILIVEDHQDAGEALRLMLELALGVPVDLAANGSLAP